jgi:hypothetical protein
MSDTESLLKTVQAAPELIDLYSKGQSPEDVRGLIEDTLRPFFDHYNSLRELAVDVLAPDYVHLCRLRTQSADTDSHLRCMRAAYLEAEDTNPDRLFVFLTDLMPDIRETGNRFWTFINLERDKSQPGPHELVRETFSNMSDLIEGLLKTHLTEHVGLRRIIGNKAFDLPTLRSAKLGVLADELLAVADYRTLLTTVPDGMRLPEWRNVAAHQAYKIVNGLVQFQRKRGSNIETVNLSPAELLKQTQPGRPFDPSH